MSLTAASVAHGNGMRMSARARSCAGDVMCMSAATINGNGMRMSARARAARAVRVSAAGVDGDCVRMCAVARCRASPAF